MGRAKNLLVAAVLVASTAGLGLVTAPTAGSVGPLVYKAELKGSNEAPPNASTATGNVTVTFSAAEDKVGVSLTFSGLGSNTNGQAHIHEAAAGSSGPIRIFFTDFPSGVTAGTYSRTLDITPAAAAAIRAGNAYVNVHSMSFPGGEIRGQLAPVAGSEVKCRGKAATAVGTQGADVLTGTEGPDVLVGLGGDDILRGRGGDDLLCGGPGHDVLLGERGKDVLAGGDGDDELWGGRGKDRLFGGNGKDELSGGAGNDFGAGGTGKDSLDSIERN